MGVDEDAAEGVPPHQPGPVEGGDQEAVGSEDGGQPNLEDPVESMPKRLLEVIERDENTTHY